MSALAGIDLEIGAGEAVGVIGPNGAGKSTLLKVLAGVTEPSAGVARVFGSVRSVIELGVGFHPELTGRENLVCGSVMLGMSRDEAQDELDAIERFAGLGDAIDQPIKHYSTGMKARLGFALATARPMGVLLVDEVLAVGDRDFQARCVDRILGFVEEGTALVFVSHEMPLVAQVCSRVVQIRDGRIVDDGPTVETIERYVAVSSRSYRSDLDPAVVVDRCVTPKVVPAGEMIDIVVDITVERDLSRPAVGIDLMLPLVEPDRILASCIDGLSALTAPGRYRLTGRGLPLPGVARNLRLTASIVDRSTQRVCGSAFDDILVVGDPEDRDVGARGYRLTLPLSFELVRTSDESRPEPIASRKASRPPASTTACVVVERASKRYRASWRRDDGAGRPWPTDRRHDETVALDGVDLRIEVGEAVGIIGANGAGKTTLLRAIAGITRLDSGRVLVDGTVVPMLELGLGFHPDLTGRDNALTMGRLIGFSPTEVESRLDELVEFAGLTGDLDFPVKHYSSGMRARLGFALAVHAPSSVLLIDEVLAVGDEEFRRRAMDAVAKRQREGTTIVFVSHELQLVEHLCDRTVWLDRGRLVDDGVTASVIDAYSGRSWAGGVHDAGSGVRLLPMSVTQRQLRTGGHVVLEGELVVDTALPHGRLEVSYRAAISDRSAALSLAERSEQSIFVATLVAPGAELGRPGTYRYRCEIGGEQLVGRLDAVLAVIDDRAERVVAEVWQEVTYGSPAPDAPPAALLDFDWSVERLDPSSAADPGRRDER